MKHSNSPLMRKNCEVGKNLRLASYPPLRFGFIQKGRFFPLMFAPMPFFTHKSPKYWAQGWEKLAPAILPGPGWVLLNYVKQNFIKGCIHEPANLQPLAAVLYEWSRSLSLFHLGTRLSLSVLPLSWQTPLFPTWRRANGGNRRTVRLKYGSSKQASGNWDGHSSVLSGTSKGVLFFWNLSRLRNIKPFFPQI